MGGLRTPLSDICVLTCGNCPTASPTTLSMTNPPAGYPTETPTESPTGDSGCKDDNAFTFSVEITGITATSCAELTTILKKPSRITKACKKLFKYPDDTGLRTPLSDICVLTCGNCPTASPTTSSPTTSSPTESTPFPTGDSGCKDDNDFTFSIEIQGF